MTIRTRTIPAAEPLAPQSPLRALIVEDNPDDAQLIVSTLKRAGYMLSFDVVDRIDDFREKLQSVDYHLVLSDHNLRTWTGEDALEIVKASGKEVGFIVVTGSLGDELAAAYIKRGAADYVLKEKLERLPSAVEVVLKERAHRAEEERLRNQIFCAKRDWELTFDTIPDPVLVLDEDCRIRRANLAACTTFQLEFRDLIGKPCHQVVHGLQEPLPSCSHQIMLSTGTAREGELVEPRLGKTFLSSTTPMRDAQGTVRGCVHVFRDITARRRAEEETKRSEAEMRSLVEGSPFGIYRVTEDGRILSANPVMVSILGYESEAEVLALKSIHDIFVDPAQRQQLIDAWKNDSPLESTEVQWKTKSGDSKTMRIAGRRMPPLTDASAAIFEVFVEDVTAQRLMEQQFLQAQKMEAVGRLAGGVAHDFNNLLMIIGSFSTLISERASDPDRVRNYAESISLASARAAGVVQQLLAFSRKQVLQPAVLDLNVVLSDLGKMLPRLLGEDIILNTVPGPQLAHVVADRTQLEQIIMNLAVNARDAMPSGGRLTIEIATVELDDRHFAAQREPIPAGEYVMLAVRDTGMGMSPETQEQVFEPFYTTKERGKGTGLGLATVYGIVKQSKGYIAIESALGEGSTFKIYLPLAKEKAHEVREQKPDPATEGTETILFTEDELLLRRVSADFLRSRGYRVLEAANGVEALEQCKTYQGDIDMLITDVVMPGIGGIELAEEIARLRPGIHILLVSGYTDRSVTIPQMEPEVAFLQKPFSLTALGIKIRKMLEDRPPEACQVALPADELITAHH